MAASDVVLDMDDDFGAVVDAAIRRHGTELVSGLIRVDEQATPCGRATAAARLWVRRYACGEPEPGGPSWHLAEIMPLVDEEVARMRTDGTLPDGWPRGDAEEFLRGCGCYACAACSARRCEVCGGWIVCGSHARPA